MPERDLELLKTAALEAGEIAVRHFRNQPKVWEKDDGQGPVTEADLEVNECLRSLLCAARPSYGWLSEENEDDTKRLESERVFIVDPIDGTRAFIDGIELFAASIAVAEAGRVIAAVVHMPAIEKTYFAHAEGGAWMNGERIVVSSGTSIDAAKVLTTKQTMDPSFWQGDVPAFSRHFRPSLAYRTCLTAAGDFDAMMTLRPVWEWDVAAGSLIMREAGARVTGRAGQMPVFNSRGAKLDGMIAAAPKLHAEIASRLVSPD